ncbi:MAG: bifunctional UDP-sugar hydrolase/5'-nucleotidase [Anaerolineales bacterium]
MLRIWVWRSLVFTLAAVSLAACQLLPGSTFWVRQSDTVRRLIVLYTNDEHGWMEPSAEAGGAGGALYRWRQEQGLTDDGPFLILSGGDMWTGPAISTVLKGESMTDVMNRMGYDAAAIGNHDFDFNPDVLRERAEQADFPLLSANLRDRSTGEIPDFAKPYVLRQVNGIRVAVIGLTTVETSVDTRPFYVQGFNFLPYSGVLTDLIPEVQSQDPDVILIIGHVCNNELHQIADVAAKFDIPLMAGGHCHERHNERVDGVTLIESGYFLRGYAVADMYVDVSKNEVVAMDTEILSNDPGPSVDEIDGRIDYWRSQTAANLWTPIGHTQAEISRQSPVMDRLLTDAWLAADPAADAVIASRRYVQQSIAAGDISEASIIGVLPVDNTLMRIQLTGQQLIDTIQQRDPVVGGLTEADDVWSLADGSPLLRSETYQVLIPDVIYYGANYFKVQSLDPDPVDTGIDWRQPVVDYLRSLGTSEANPLDAVLTPVAGVGS